MEITVLVVNPGSSSYEYAIYKQGALLLSAYYEHSHDNRYNLTISSQDQEEKTVEIESKTFDNALHHFLSVYKESDSINTTAISAIGIRLVAPGRRFLSHKQLDAELHEYLINNIGKAPLHIGVELEQIKQIKENLPDHPIFIISDSEFHKTLSHEARNYAIPKTDAELYDIYRFGYHGISVKSVVHVLREDIKADYHRVIVCHLGSGSSITAVRDWQSIETSMGYSPLEGLIMATRSGNIDAEAALELKERLNLSDKQLTEYLNKKSGLLGLSGSSNDIRVLLEKEANGDPNAKFALDAMVYRIQSYIGAYYAILGGVDAIVFTATVGERSAILRRRICESVSHIGIELDNFKNDSTNAVQEIISRKSSKIAVHVIPSNEPAELARQTIHLLANN